MGCNMEKMIPSMEERRTVSQRKEAWEGIKNKLPVMKTSEGKALREELFSVLHKQDADTITMDEMLKGLIDKLHMDEFTSRLKYVVRRSFGKVKKLLGDERNPDKASYREFCLIISYIYFRFQLRIMLDDLFPEGKEVFTFDDFQKAVPNLKEWGLRIGSASRIFKDIDKKNKESITFDQISSWGAGKKLAEEGDPDEFEHDQ
ncbi:unnamed protein product [Phytomonas sp. EM1]|nr:unnamed protein product [Phytomonas sp. EM1]|eukprot:CCW65787.1 unnamed protein product [Phytomonas sp. isolate EM1]